MYIILDTHDTVLNNHNEACELFLTHLDNEGRRVREEHEHEHQQLNRYDNIFDPETMNTTNKAVWQWLNDNPGWWNI